MIYNREYDEDDNEDTLIHDTKYQLHRMRLEYNTGRAGVWLLIIKWQKSFDTILLIKDRTVVRLLMTANSITGCEAERRLDVSLLTVTGVVCKNLTCVSYLCLLVYHLQHPMYLNPDKKTDKKDLVQT